MILQTDMKLSQVAHESGFNDYKYFKKSFEAQFCCLPSEYQTKILHEMKLNRVNEEKEHSIGVFFLIMHDLTCLLND